MSQLIKARKEIAIAQIEQTNPLQGYKGANYRECTKRNPMPKGCENISRWQHNEEVHEIECGSDYYARYKCGACGHEWKEELPE